MLRAEQLRMPEPKPDQTSSGHTDNGRTLGASKRSPEARHSVTGKRQRGGCAPSHHGTDRIGQPGAWYRAGCFRILAA